MALKAVVDAILRKPKSVSRTATQTTLLVGILCLGLTCESHRENGGAPSLAKAQRVRDVDAIRPTVAPEAERTMVDIKALVANLLPLVM